MGGQNIISAGNITAPFNLALPLRPLSPISLPPALLFRPLPIPRLSLIRFLHQLGEFPQSAGESPSSHHFIGALQASLCASRIRPSYSGSTFAIAFWCYAILGGHRPVHRAFAESTMARTSWMLPASCRPVCEILCRFWTKLRMFKTSSAQKDVPNRPLTSRVSCKSSAPKSILKPPPRFRWS